MVTDNEIYMAILHDEDDLAHYGRIGMKWYQHIYGEYQGAAKYAEKGEKKLAKAKQRDDFRGRGESARTKRLKSKLTAVREEMKAAKKREAEKAKDKAADAEEKQRITKEKEAVVSAEEHDNKIRNLAQGKGDWRNASGSELQEAIGRLELEKKYKELRDDVSGMKVLKELGYKGSLSIANKAGDIVNTLLTKAAENYNANQKFLRDQEKTKSEREYNEQREKAAEEKKAREAKEAEDKAAKAEEKKAREAKEAEEKAAKDASAAEKAAADKETSRIKRLQDLISGKSDYKNASEDDLAAAVKRVNALSKFENATKKDEPKPEKPKDSGPTDVWEDDAARKKYDNGGWSTPKELTSRNRKSNTSTNKMNLSSILNRKELADSQRKLKADEDYRNSYHKPNMSSNTSNRNSKSTKKITLDIRRDSEGNNFATNSFNAKEEALPTPSNNKSNNSSLLDVFRKRKKKN